MLRRSSSITASDTLAVGMSTLVSATTGGLSTGSSSLGRRREDRIAGIGLGLGVSGLGVAVLEPALVAAQLLLDPVGGELEGGRRQRRGRPSP